MKRLVLNAMLAVFLGVAGTESLAAQSTGAGGIIDWIHKLSGPSLIGGGLTAYTSLVKDGEVTRVRGRFTVVLRTSIDEEGEIEPSDSNVLMLSVQPTLEIPIVRYGALASVDFSAGMAFHRFAGDVDGFWHYSIPVFLQARIPIQEGPVIARLGAGVHYFPEFDEDDFMPLNVTVSTDGGELVLGLYGGLEYRF